MKGQTTTEKYDTSGTIIAETSAGTTTYSLPDGNNPSGYTYTLEQSTTQGGALTQTFILGPTGVLAQADSAGVVHYLLTDGHGSTRQLVDSGGAVNTYYAFDAYGNQLATSIVGSITTQYLYTGQQWDPGVGQYDLRARFYDPGIGRFSSFDSYSGSTQDPLTLHKYLYAQADPLSGFDPTGHVLDTNEQITVNGLTRQEMARERLMTIKPAFQMARSVVKVEQVGSRMILRALALLSAGGGMIGGAWYLYNEIALHYPYLGDMVKADKEAIDKAVRDWHVPRDEAENLPIFHVWRRGAESTPEIWQNDFNALTGAPIGGLAWPAPPVLNYLRGANDYNRYYLKKFAALFNVSGTSTRSIDEYPYASTQEGGLSPFLHVAAVLKTEQDKQRDQLLAFYKAYSAGFKPLRFLVALVP